MRLFADGFGAFICVSFSASLRDSLTLPPRACSLVSCLLQLGAATLCLRKCSASWSSLQAFIKFLVQFLDQRQATIYLVNPSRVRKFADGMGILSKNDLIDAKAICCGSDFVCVCLLVATHNVRSSVKKAISQTIE